MLVTRESSKSENLTFSSSALPLETIFLLSVFLNEFRCRELENGIKVEESEKGVQEKGWCDEFVDLKRKSIREYLVYICFFSCLHSLNRRT